MARRAVYCITVLLCAFILGGCSLSGPGQQEDMGISLEKFAEVYNRSAATCGAETIDAGAYRKIEGEENGYCLYTLSQGTELYIAVTGKGNVASIQLYLQPDGINGGGLQEVKNTAMACIQTLNAEQSRDILFLTGLNDIEKSTRALQENPEAYFLYFYDTNSKGLDPVHGKQYRLWYSNGLKYTIMYPLQG